MSKKSKPSAGQQRTLRFQQIVLYAIGILVILSMVLSLVTF